MSFISNFKFQVVTDLSKITGEKKISLKQLISRTKKRFGKRHWAMSPSIVTQTFLFVYLVVYMNENNPLISQNLKAISSLNIVNAIRALKAISSLNINMVNVIQKKTGSSENKRNSFRKPTNSAKAKKE